MYPRRSKAEALVNAVDVVERLHDLTDPSTESLDDVPRALDPVEDEGELTVMMKLPTQGFA